MLQNLLASGYFYYSHTLNITQTFQRIASLNDDNKVSF